LVSIESSHLGLEANKGHKAQVLQCPLQTGILVAAGWSCGNQTGDLEPGYHDVSDDEDGDSKDYREEDDDLDSNEIAELTSKEKLNSSRSTQKANLVK
jgi:hypothetical protein